MSSKSLSAPGVGHVGPLLSARCTSCGKTSQKRTTETVGDASSGSFRHVCHSCQCVTWWNALAVLEEVDPE